MEAIDIRSSYKQEYYSDVYYWMKKNHWNKDKAQQLFKVHCKEGGVYVGTNRVPTSVLNKYTNSTYHRNKLLTKIIERCAGIVLLPGNNVKPKNNKEWNAMLTALLGRSPVSFYSHIRGLVWKTHVVDAGVLHYINLTKRSKGKINMDLYRLVIKNKSVMDEYVKDGLHHLLPVAMFKGLTTKEAKAAFGKSCWKKMCSNSFTRNYKIMYDSWNWVFDLGVVINIPSSILSNKYQRFYKDPSFGFCVQWLKINKRLSKDRMYNERLFILVRDMWHERKPKLSWNFDKIREEHTRAEMIKRQKEGLERCSKEPFPMASVFNQEINLGDGYSAVYLSCPYEMQEEGIAMGHCIGGYFGKAQEGNQLFFSIRKDGKRVSSIQLVNSFLHYGSDFKGIEVNGELWEIGQHYGYCNSFVDNETKDKGSMLLKQVAHTMKTNNE